MQRYFINYDEKVYPDSFFVESFDNLNNKIFKLTALEMTRRLAGKHCKVLELGAGMCWTGLMASKLPFIEEIHCMDISTNSMQKYVPVVNKYVQGNLLKLVFTEGDFNELLPFPDCSFDVVLFDATPPIRGESGRPLRRHTGY